MMEQTLYKGRYADSKPTEAQLELLKKMNVRENVIQSLTREQAFKLIRAITIRYYTDKFQKQRKTQGVLKW